MRASSGPSIQLWKEGRNQREQLWTRVQDTGLRRKGKFRESVIHIWKMLIVPVTSADKDLRDLLKFHFIPFQAI